MRVASAWFLLLLSLTHWVGAHLCFEVSHFAEVRRQVDEREQALADALRESVGSRSMIFILSAEEIAPKGNFYGDFVFSEEVSGETVYFNVVDESKAVTEVKVTPQQQPPAEDDGKTALLKSLFQEFEMTSLSLPVAEMETRSAASFHFSQRLSPSTSSIPAPPPDFS